MVARASREVRLHPIGGDRDHLRDALAGEPGEPAAGVEDRAGAIGGLGGVAGYAETLRTWRGDTSASASKSRS